MQPGRELPAPTQLHMAPQVLAAICETIGTRKAETGGILGGCRETGKVTHFCFDEEAKRSSIIYTPNNVFLNAVKREWRQQGIDFLGSIHSHPPSFRRPSVGDEVYVRRILDVLDVPYMLVHIVTTLADTGSFSLYPFAAVREGNGVRIVEQELVVGDSLIRPERTQPPDTAEDGEEALALLMELNMAAMLYGSVPVAGMAGIRRRCSGYSKRERINYD